MPLLDHLIELRKRLIYALVGFFLVFFVTFYFAKPIFSFLIQPALADGYKVVVLDIFEFFFVTVKLSGFVALIVGFPLIAVQIWMFVAPGTAHLGLRRTATGVRVALDSTPAPSRCMPSVDPMFDAVAHAFGRAGIGVVLTGMGRDGTLGARALIEAGGDIMAQDAATSVVWGMPGSVAQAGLASAVMPPEALAQRICMRAGIT